MRVIRRSFSDLSSYTLLIGRSGENETSRLEVNVSKELQTYPQCSFELLLQMPGCTDVYPVITELNDDLLSYTFNISDLSSPGYGKMELVMFGADGEVKKSAVAKTRIEASLTPGNCYPGPIQRWIEFFEAQREIYETLVAKIGNLVEFVDLQAILATFTIDDEGYLCADTSTGYAKIDEDGYLCFDVGTVARINEEFLEVVA